MILFYKLIITGFLLFLFVTFFLDDVKNKDNVIWYKLYIFLFMFFIQIIVSFVNSIFTKEIISYPELIDSSITNALLTVVAFDVYGDMVLKDYINDLSQSQKNLLLVLLVIGFMVSIRLIQMLFSTNAY